MCVCPPCVYVAKSIVKSINVVMSMTFSEAVCWSGCGRGLVRGFVRPKLTSPAIHSNETANRKSPPLIRTRHFQNKTLFLRENMATFYTWLQPEQCWTWRVSLNIFYQRNDVTLPVNAALKFPQRLKSHNDQACFQQIQIYSWNIELNVQQYRPIWILPSATRHQHLTARPPC